MVGSPIRSLASAQYGELSASRSSSKFSPSVVCLVRMSSWLGFRVQHSRGEVLEHLRTERALVAEGLRLEQLKLTERGANTGSAHLQVRSSKFEWRSSYPPRQRICRMSAASLDIQQATERDLHLRDVARLAHDVEQHVAIPTLHISIVLRHQPVAHWSQTPFR
eukprot:scaffold82584_cov60-Phaeocystis_antarctica.AAC.2